VAEGGAEAGGGVLFRLLRCACPLAVASAPTPPGWKGDFCKYLHAKTLRSSGNNLLQELCGVFALETSGNLWQHLRTALIGCQREMGPLAAQGTDPTIGGADHHAAPPSSSPALCPTISTAVVARACLLSALSALAAVDSAVVLSTSVNFCTFGRWLWPPYFISHSISDPDTWRGAASSKITHKLSLV
jgi:hypothetical protein